VALVLLIFLRINEHTGRLLVGGQMHCGPPNQNFGWIVAHPAHAAAPLLMPK